MTATTRAQFVAQQTNARLADYDRASSVILADHRRGVLSTSMAGALLTMEVETAADHIVQLEAFAAGEASC